MSNLSNTVSNVRSSYLKLRPAERWVADEVLRDPRRVLHLSINQLAQDAKVSEATVVKFCKRLGYKGFQEFKIMLAQDVASKSGLAVGEVELGDDIQTIKEKTFHAHLAALQETVRALDSEKLEAVVRAMTRAGEIHCYGLGNSGLAAIYAVRKFSSLGLPVSAFVDPHLQIVRAAHLMRGDVVVALSCSGETKGIIEAMRAAKEAGALGITITCNPNSTLAIESDLPLLISAQKDSESLVQLGAIDTLFAAVALVDHFHTEQALEKTEEVLAQRS